MNVESLKQKEGDFLTNLTIIGLSLEEILKDKI